MTRGRRRRRNKIGTQKLPQKVMQHDFTGRESALKARSPWRTSKHLLSQPRLWKLPMILIEKSLLERGRVLYLRRKKMGTSFEGDPAQTRNTLYMKTFNGESLPNNCLAVVNNFYLLHVG